MWQHVQLSQQICPLNTFACCWEVRQPVYNKTCSAVILLVLHLLSACKPFPPLGGFVPKQILFFFSFYSFLEGGMGGCSETCFALSKKKGGKKRINRNETEKENLVCVLFSSSQCLTLQQY